MEGDSFEGKRLWVQAGILQILQEVFDVSNLAGLGDSIALRLEAPGSIKVHHCCAGGKKVEVQEEAANDRACPSLSMVAMEDCDSF